jgi:hypothetical protein
MVCNAANRYVMKRTGSLSPSSSDNQATGLPQSLIQLLTNVVLPKPAEAEMSVSLQPIANPLFSRSIKRGRGTMLGRGGGMYSLVAKTGAGILVIIQQGKFPDC